MLHTPHAGVCARCLLGSQVRAQLSAHQNKRTLSKLGHIIDHNPGLHRPFKALPAFDPASKPWPPAWALCVAESRRSTAATKGAGGKVCHFVAQLIHKVWPESDGQTPDSMDWLPRVYYGCVCGPEIKEKISACRSNDLGSTRSARLRCRHRQSSPLRQQRLTHVLAEC